MITADNITDEQIKALASYYERTEPQYRICRVALGHRDGYFPQTTQQQARARCVEIIRETYEYTCKYCDEPIRLVLLDETPTPYASFPRDDANCTHAPNHEPATTRVPRTVRRWLRDYFAMIEHTEMERMLSGLAMREVESIEEARALVNRSIDAHISWCNDLRPTETK